MLNRPTKSLLLRYPSWSLPPALWQGSIQNPAGHTCWSVHPVRLRIRSNRFLWLLIRWHWFRDPRGLFRAYRKWGGIWNGSGVLLWDGQRFVGGSTAIQVARDVLLRLANSYEWDKIAGKIITRYSFSYHSMFPQAKCKGFDLHHLKMNPSLDRLTQVVGYREAVLWSAASFDHSYNLKKEDPFRHKQIHEERGEIGFRKYIDDWGSLNERHTCTEISWVKPSRSHWSSRHTKISLCCRIDRSTTLSVRTELLATRPELRAMWDIVKAHYKESGGRVIYSPQLMLGWA